MEMKKFRSVMSAVIASCGLLLAVPAANAIPSLQVGAPGGSGEDSFADYLTGLSDPTEDDTAITGGNTILVGATYGSNDISVGGQGLGDDDWTAFKGPPPEKDAFPNAFAGVGGILLVSVPDGSGVSLSITVDDGAAISPFFTSPDMDFFPNNHAPVQADVSDFLFFNIGEFSSSESVPNFVDETGSADGEIKEIVFSVTAGDPAWLHFDALALFVDSNKNSKITTTLGNNPGSKDTTWKDGGPPPPPPPSPAPGAMPEPISAVTGAMGLAVLGSLIRRRR
jgi:hypothetical protein